MSYTYQWERRDSSGLNPVDIVGATAQTYLLQAADVGHTVGVRVSDGANTVEATPTAVIQPISYPAWVRPGISLFNDNGRYASFGNKEKWTMVISQQGDAHLVNAQETPANNAYNVKAGPYFTLIGAASSGVDWGMTFAKAASLADTFSPTDGQTHSALMRSSYPSGPYLQENGFAGVYIIDPLNTNVQAWMKSNILNILRANPNYLGEYWPYLNLAFFDDFTPDYRNLADAPGGTVWPCPLYTSLSAWKTAFRELARVVIAYLQQNGIYCVGNDRALYRDGGSGLNDTTDTLGWWDFMIYDGAGMWRPGQSVLDGHFGELWIYTPSGNLRRKGTVNFYDEWDSWMRQPENAAARGTDFHGSYTGQGAGSSLEQRAARYTRATFLLSWNGNYSTANFEPSDGVTDPFSLANLSDGDLGTPIEARYEVNGSGAPSSGTGIWVRHFSNGWVIVNSTYTGPTTVTGYGIVASADAIIHVGP